MYYVVSMSVLRVSLLQAANINNSSNQPAALVVTLDPVFSFTLKGNRSSRKRVVMQK